MTDRYESGTDRSMMRDAVLVSALAFAYLTISTLSAALMAVFDPGVGETFGPDVVTALLVLPRVTTALWVLNFDGVLQALTSIPLTVGGIVGATLLTIFVVGHTYIMVQLSRGYYDA